MEDAAAGNEREHGAQPVDRLMEQWQLDNHDLVEISTEQLTHKQVQRARSGRQLTLKMMQKVTRALNVAVWTRLTEKEKDVYFEYMHKHLFNYAKNYDEKWQDPNEEIMPE